MVDGNELLAQSGVNTRFWQEFIAPRVIQFKGGCCETCGTDKHVDVHHTRYDVQTIHTFMVLCRKCHKQWHKENGSATELMQRYGVVNYTNKEE